MLLVDTNVLIDVLENDPVWADWSVQQLRAQAQVHELTVNPAIYAELSLAFESVDALDNAVSKMSLLFEEIPRPALFLAARAFMKYRRAGGNRSNVLADFFIGAHAAVASCGILTRDAGRYASYFPRVPLVTPQSGSTP